MSPWENEWTAFKLESYSQVSDACFLLAWACSFVWYLVRITRRALMQPPKLIPVICCHGHMAQVPPYQSANIGGAKVDGTGMLAIIR